jgi:AhpC/TSA family
VSWYRRRGDGRIALAILALLPLAISSAARGESVPADVGDATLRDGRGTVVPLSRIAADHRFTVVVFYSSTCPCFAVHVARLGRLSAELRNRGVAFLAVDSERHGPGEPTPPPAAAPGVPLFRDDGGLLARRLNARFATQAFVIDPTGQVRYGGGLDSDRKDLTAAPHAYLRDALINLLGSDSPRYATSKALGCALRLF